MNNLTGTTIEVREDHIRRGIQHRTQLCPVALALADKLDISIENVTVANTWLSVHNGDVRDPCAIIYHVPDNVTTFIRNFDSGMSIQSFSFQIGMEISK